MANTTTRSDNYLNPSNANKGYASMDQDKARDIAERDDKAGNNTNDQSYKKDDTIYAPGKNNGTNADSSNDNNKDSNSNQHFNSIDEEEVDEILVGESEQEDPSRQGNEDDDISTTNGR